MASLLCKIDKELGWAASAEAPPMVKSDIRRDDSYKTICSIRIKMNYLPFK